jgi:predicted PurR-regulated permease PerM
MLKLLTNLPSWLRLTLLFPLLFLNGFLLAVIISYLQPLFDFVIIAAILAFILELVIRLLQQKGMKRDWAIASVLILTLTAVIIIGAILIPLIVFQLTQLIDSAPQWISETSKQLTNFAQLPIFNRLPINIDSVIADAARELSNALKSLGTQTLNILIGTIASAVNTLLILIMTIFLLIGGDTFWDGIFSWLPSLWRTRVQEYLEQTFKDYFFSKLILALLSSLARLLIFLLLGVPYATLFAFSIGIAGLIPFFGNIITILGVILLSFKSLNLAIIFLVVAVIIDQITDNVIAPRLIGESIGLNPVWLLISLFIGAKLAGILGLFIAVPLASVIKRIVNDLRSEFATASEGKTSYSQNPDGESDSQSKI